MKNDHKRRNIIIILTILVVGAFIYIAGSGIRNALAGGIQVNAVPNDSKVTIDNNKVATDKLISVSPGEHTVTVSRDGFATKTQKVTIKTRDKQLLNVFLGPNSAVGDQWVNTHPDQMTQVEGASSAAYDKLSTENTDNNPIVSQLPLLDPRFRIDYGVSAAHPDDQNAIGIYITASTPDDRQAALNLIRDTGFDPSDMEIIFRTPQE